MMTQWHGWHLCAVEDNIEMQRLGSIHPEPIEMWGDQPTEYAAAGVYHRPAAFWTFEEAQQYLDGRRNRPPVSAAAWSWELYGPAQ
jgi:hypothetical protein